MELLSFKTDLLFISAVYGASFGKKKSSFLIHLKHLLLWQTEASQVHSHDQVNKASESVRVRSGFCSSNSSSHPYHRSFYALIFVTVKAAGGTEATPQVQPKRLLAQHAKQLSISVKLCSLTARCPFLGERNGPATRSVAPQSAAPQVPLLGGWLQEGGSPSRGDQPASAAPAPGLAGGGAGGGSSPRPALTDAPHVLFCRKFLRCSV